jgi:hypothetical protein
VAKTKATGSNARHVTKDTSTSRQDAEEKSRSNDWKPSEVVALYSVQSQTSPNIPDFWFQVSEALSERGVFRTEQECMQRWFVVSFLYCFILFYLWKIPIN